MTRGWAALLGLLVPAVAAADPVALRAAGPDRGWAASVGVPDPSVGLRAGPWGGALTLHEGAALALDGARRWVVRERPRGQGTGEVGLSASAGLLVPVVAPGVGLSAGGGVDLRRLSPRGAGALGLWAPAAATWAGSASSRIPVVASAAAAWPGGPARWGMWWGLQAEAGRVISPGDPGALLGRLALTVSGGAPR